MITVMSLLAIDGVMIIAIGSIARISVAAGHAWLSASQKKTRTRDTDAYGAGDHDRTRSLHMHAQLGPF